MLTVKKRAIYNYTTGNDCATSRTKYYYNIASLFFVHKSLKADKITGKELKQKK